MVIQAPCTRDCEKREIGCHSVCQAYINYRIEWDKVKKNQAERVELDAIHFESMARMKKNRKRKRRS